MSRSGISSSINVWDFMESVDRVLVTLDKTLVLLQYSLPNSRGQKQKDTLLFDIAIIPIAAFPDPSSHSTHKQPQSPKSPASKLHLRFDQSLNSATSSACGLKQLESFPLPSELISCIETPLAFLFRDRLVILDHNFWLCSWRLLLPYKATTLQGHNSAVQRLRHT